MRRPLALLLALVAAATALAACGSSATDQRNELRARLITPPRYVGALPLPSPAPTADPAKLRDPRPTAKTAERLRSVLAGWATALRRGDGASAGEYFVLPAIVYQPNRGPVEVGTPDALAAFHASLPCGAKLEEVQQDGRYVVGTFTLTERPGHVCDAPGQLVRVGFVFGDPTHPRRFTEWWQVSDKRGAAPGPSSRPEAPAADVSSFG